MPPSVLNPGDGFLIPPRTPHNARDLGPETGRMLSTYIVETGQPIATFVKQPVQQVGRARSTRLVGQRYTRGSQPAGDAWLRMKLSTVTP